MTATIIDGKASAAKLREKLAAETARLRSQGMVRGWDWIAFNTSFHITMLEGIEVVFIVIALGSGRGMLVPASVGAVAACLLVAAIGLIVHRPLARVPENTLKFAVGNNLWSHVRNRQGG